MSGRLLVGPTGNPIDEVPPVRGKLLVGPAGNPIDEVWNISKAWTSKHIKQGFFQRPCPSCVQGVPPRSTLEPQTTEVREPKLESWRQTYFNSGTIAFWSVHIAAIVGVAIVGLSWSGVIIALSAYAIRMIIVTAGYHRYFAHRTFKTSRWFQLLLAFLCQTSAQRGVLWWASHHREHHQHSDQPADPHSALRRGFLWAHMGWLLSNSSNGTDLDRVRDLAKFPELRALQRVQHLPLVLLAIALFLIGGVHLLVWGFFVSTVALWHGTFTINSLSHMFGRRRYKTTDSSRNSVVLALLTMGEGWHNNHHHYQSSAAQGFFWWEIDVSMLALRSLERLGLIWDLRRAPKHVIEGRRRKGLPVTEFVERNPLAVIVLPLDIEQPLDGPRPIAERPSV